MFSSGQSVCAGCGFDDGWCVRLSLLMKLIRAPAFTTILFGVTPAPVIVTVVVSTGGVPPPPPPSDGPEGDPSPPQDHTLSASAPVKNADASQCRRAMYRLPKPDGGMCRGHRAGLSPSPRVCWREHVPGRGVVGQRNGGAGPTIECSRKFPTEARKTLTSRVNRFD
jgi:hypothetical protein